MKVVLVTAHAADAGRKTGFHFWADILSQRKIDVAWLTVGFSRITELKKNGRSYNRPYNTWVRLNDHFKKFVWHAPFHPADFRNEVLNRLTTPLFSLYPRLLPKAVLDEVRNADLFIIESGSGIMLVETLAKLCPKARFIYNFSDRYQVVHFHPVIMNAEKASLHLFDIIRVNAAVVADHFPSDAPVVYLPQAIDKSLFNKDIPNPYQSKRNAISIGDMLFDAAAIQALAKRFPDWTFHLFGKGSVINEKMPNVVEHGEFPFNDLVPYLMHADIGLAPYRDAQNAEYLSQSSLKLVQYSYCRLPIVAPAFASIGRAHVLSYDASQAPDDIIQAFEKAIRYDRSSIDPKQVLSWEDYVDRMLDLVSIPYKKAA